MFGYIFILSLTLVFASIFLVDESYNENDKIKKIYLILNSIALVIFFGFRGPFTSDYINYKEYFELYKKISILDIVTTNVPQEKGYVLLNKIIQIFGGDFVTLQVIIGIIIIGLIFREIYKESSYVWLSVFLYVIARQYYASFNITRQVLASAIIFSGSKYLYERNFKKYLIFILIATFIHRSSIIMLPFYFILNMKNNKKLNLTILAGFILVFENIKKLLEIITKYYFKSYSASSFGMSGFNYKNIVLPVGILLFVMANRYLLKLEDDKKANIWVNSVIYFAFFNLLGTKIMMIERIGHFFLPYSILIIPLIIKKQENMAIKGLYLILIIFLGFGYNYFSLNNSGYDPYYFIFNSIN
ncbi:EpsG family protein [Fusobacterium sp. MFO224]|uniref:EpsG family protein n=1 Tax=Fusobacterium sp. MFO224 TaxID=3378070 RepID=UPI0038543138